MNGAIGWGITLRACVVSDLEAAGAAADLWQPLSASRSGPVWARNSPCAGTSRAANRGLAPPPAATPGQIELVPESLLVRSVWLGVLSVPVFAFPALLALYWPARTCARLAFSSR